MTYLEKYGVAIRSVDFQDDGKVAIVTFMDGTVRKLISDIAIAAINRQMGEQQQAILDGEFELK
jgi:hypothetical protein